MLFNIRPGAKKITSLQKEKISKEINKYKRKFSCMKKSRPPTHCHHRGAEARKKGTKILANIRMARNQNSMCGWLDGEEKEVRADSECT